MLVRDATEADAAGIASLSRENGAYYAHIAPDRFRVPDENGFVDFIRNDMDWRARPDTLSLVAEVDGEVAGYLEASLQPPLDSAPWQSQRDVGETRLLINFVGTADRHKRQGVATELVEAAEAWGRSQGATVSICDTFIESPLSVPFWEQRMNYERQAIIFRKQLA
ncbi:MAG: GNAT family N-acetyltransferase [Gaiellaceae bacterium]|jgi:GNAT superfamily N-acetyltransferase